MPAKVVGGGGGGGGGSVVVGDVLGFYFYFSGI